MKLAFFLALASLAAGQTTKLADNVYCVSGPGGNSGVIIGRKGVTLIDGDRQSLAAEVAKLTPRPVTATLLTHSDKPVTKSHEEMTIDGVKFIVFHWGPAHTRGDLIISLPDQKIVFTGNFVDAQRDDPVINLEKGGSTQGWLDTMSMIQKLDSNTFVPGRGDIQTRQQLRIRKVETFDRRTRIKALLDEGKTPEEVKQETGDPSTLIDIIHREAEAANRARGRLSDGPARPPQ